MYRPASSSSLLLKNLKRPRFVYFTCVKRNFSPRNGSNPGFHSFSFTLCFEKSENWNLLRCRVLLAMTCFDPSGRCVLYLQYWYFGFYLTKSKCATKGTCIIYSMLYICSFLLCLYLFLKIHCYLRDLGRLKVGERHPADESCSGKILGKSL